MSQCPCPIGPHRSKLCQFVRLVWSPKARLVGCSAVFAAAAWHATVRPLFALTVGTSVLRCCAPERLLLFLAAPAMPRSHPSAHRPSDHSDMIRPHRCGSPLRLEGQSPPHRTGAPILRDAKAAFKFFAWSGKASENGAATKWTTAGTQSPGRNLRFLSTGALPDAAACPVVLKNSTVDDRPRKPTFPNPQ